MLAFNFTVSAYGLARIHDVLSCLAKFDEQIFFEAHAGELRISSLNPTKTAYASFIFHPGFFERYHFSRGERKTRKSVPAPWACKLQNRALWLILKKRLLTGKEKETVQETAVLRCEFELEARDDLAKSRLVFKLICLSSVVKTFRLNYDSAEVLHATFDKEASQNTWQISARTLRDVVDYFGPKTEHVDWSLNEDGKVTFTSYTEKIQVGAEVIRQPTHTSVQLEDKDFDMCRMEKDLHISIPVKDFRSIISHAETMKANIKAMYSSGHRPTQITYGNSDMTARFTLMTKGTASAAADASRAQSPARGLSVQPTSQPAKDSRGSSRTSSRTGFVSGTTPRDFPLPAEEPQRDALPSRPSASGPTLTSTPMSVRDESAAPKPKHKPLPSVETQAPPASVNPDSLFFPAPEDDDQQWDPPNFDDEPEMVTWDHADSHHDRDVLPPSFVQRWYEGRELREGDGSAVTSFNTALEDHDHAGSFEIGPTQGRLSQMKSMFDE